ncbi:MAG: autotransporter-associated beta strand repeat-containing protein [Pirellulales bacterium]|nr:autotransporter-associated beta strand repeat-containing protein [Pirellulales bacterium]
MSLVFLAAGSGTAAITWVGDGVNNYWDTTSVVWDSDNDGIADTVYTDDIVLGTDVVFDDMGSTDPWIELVGILHPGSITFDVDSAFYLVTALGGDYTNNNLQGSTSMAKYGSGKVHIDFGSSTTGFTGDVNVYAGTLAVDRIGSVGDSTGITRVHNGATLDIAGTSLAAEDVYVQGAGVDVDTDGIGDGALYNGLNTRIGEGNTYYRYDQINAFINITLEGNTTVGGVGRMDVKNGTLTANGYNLTIKMTGKDLAPEDGDCDYFSINSEVITDLANVNVEQGVLNLSRLTSLGTETATLTVGTGAEGPAASVRLYYIDYVAPSGITKNLVMNGGSLNSATGLNVWNGPVTLNLDASVRVADEGGYGAALTFTNTIDGAGGMTKTGPGTLTLQGACSYLGATAISEGTLVLSGSATLSGTPTIDVGVDSFFDVSAVTGGFALGSGQTLMGEGDVLGNVAASADSHVAPGSSVGTLTFANDLDLAGSLDIEYDGDTDVVDLLKVTGILDMDGATISVSGAGSLDAGAYVFASYGSLTGTVASELGLLSGWSINYAYDDGESTNNIALIVTGTLIPGDTDGNQIVNEADALVLSNNWGASVTQGDYSAGDFNDDGVVNAADAAILAANWGDHTGGEATAPVPEPTMLVLILAGLAGMTLARRRGRQG